MTYKIHRKKHRAWPVKLWLWLNKKTITKRVTFHFNCQYDLGTADQDDHNKLFGIGYLWSHHTDSARIGWRYDNKVKRLIVSAYCYVSRQRIAVDICHAMMNKPYLITLNIEDGFYELKVVVADTGYLLGSTSIPYWHKKKWSFPLGFFFGGNQPAPHSMSIEMKNV